MCRSNRFDIQANSSSECAEATGSNSRDVKKCRSDRKFRIFVRISERIYILNYYFRNFMQKKRRECRPISQMTGNDDTQINFTVASSQRISSLRMFGITMPKNLRNQLLPLPSHQPLSSALTKNDAIECYYHIISVKHSPQFLFFLHL